MIGILIPNKCAENVTAVFDRLYAELHITKIDPKEVILKPRLVGIEMN